MARKGAAKRDLWKSGNDDRTVNRPQQVYVAKGWSVEPSKTPQHEEAPRRRKYAPIRPNNRPAVAVPLEGQSYNPTDEAHQAALATAVKKLEKRQENNEKFVKMLMLGREGEHAVKTKTGSAGTGMSRSVNAPDDVLYDEEVKEFKQKAPKAPKSEEELRKEAKEKKKKEKRQKKLGKVGARQELRQSIALRRRPNEKKALEGFEKLDEVLDEFKKKEAKREARREKRRAAKRENLKIKHYGRHYHTPLAVDVASSDQLVGSLRHVSGGRIHPALDRMKSLEERNLVPARMQHKYNKRKILKPKGEVRVKTEPFGILPET